MAGTASTRAKPNCSAVFATRRSPTSSVSRTVGTFSERSNDSRNVTRPRNFSS
jgi:hypothetical protein